MVDLVVHPPDLPANIVGAIPARYDSTRLPGKALRELAGLPMIERVYRQVQKAGSLDRVVVLTDDRRIADVVEGFGGNCEMTPKECASGTDRIAHAARDWLAEIVLNIQGDEPLIEPEALDSLARHLADHPEVEVATLAAPADDDAFLNPNVVKAVVDSSGRALYFSRAPIPHRREPNARRPLRHIGVYGYRRRTLLRIAAMPPSPLEQTEALEQLRILEGGIPIHVLTVDRAWPGVDTIEDLREVESLLARRAPAAS